MKLTSRSTRFRAANLMVDVRRAKTVSVRRTTVGIAGDAHG
jgi:hypothetical protein